MIKLNIAQPYQSVGEDENHALQYFTEIAFLLILFRDLILCHSFGE